MSVLTLIENWEGKFKKTSFETLSYGKQIANKIGVDLIAVTYSGNNIEQLAQYGADTIINISNISFESSSNHTIAKICTELSTEYNANHIIISNTNLGKAINPLIASDLNAGCISNAIAVPERLEPLIIKCKAFSGKAYAKYQSNYKKNVINILPNSIGEINNTQGAGKIINIEKTSNNQVQIIQRNKSNEKISLSDAEVVVSAGRGLKSADNWDMIEELATILDAGTACSKPVSDMGWRPHSEHVGQTGLAINPDLYIAIGISGAIQHLAGVNSSKNIVVINTDPEAPFFKSANYGIIGDAFVIVPKLIAALKKYKN